MSTNLIFYIIFPNSKFLPIIISSLNSNSFILMFQDRFSGLAIHGLAMNANVVFSRMQMESVLPDSITFIGILTACSHCGFVEEGHKYFGMMQNRFMIQPQLKHYGTVVDLFLS